MRLPRVPGGRTMGAPATPPGATKTIARRVLLTRARDADISGQGGVNTIGFW
jgi:hypothetical protein